MYAKIYNYKFPGLSEAKVEATFCSEGLGKKIVQYNIRSLNISIGQCGSVAIHLKFETSEDLKSFENEVLKPRWMRIRTTASGASFTGIAGKSQSSSVLARVPCFTGPILGNMKYDTQTIGESYLPMLLSCYSMRELGFVINTTTDCLYIPRSVEAARNRRSTQWYEVPLIWTGQHYLLPIDLADQHYVNLLSF